MSLLVLSIGITVAFRIFSQVNKKQFNSKIPFLAYSKGSGKHQLCSYQIKKYIKI